MTEKKGYEPEDQKEPIQSDVPTPAPDYTVLLSVIRKANGQISCFDNMKECRSIEEALLIRSKVWYWCDKFIQFCEYMQSEEKRKLAVAQPGMLQALRNGLKKK